MFSYHPYLNVEALLHITNCSKALSLQNCIYTLTFIKQELGPSPFVGTLTLIMLDYVGCQYCLKCQTSFLFFVNTQRFLLFLQLLLLQAFRKIWARLTDTYSLLSSLVNLNHTGTNHFCLAPTQNFVVWIGHYNSTVVDE